MKIIRNGIWTVLLLIAGLFSLARLHGDIPWVYFLVGNLHYIAADIILQRKQFKVHYSSLYRIGNHVFYSLIIIGLLTVGIFPHKIPYINGYSETNGLLSIWFAWYLVCCFVGVVIPGLFDLLVRMYRSREWQTLAEILLVICCVLWSFVVIVHSPYVPFPYLVLATVQTICVRCLKATNALFKWGNYIFYVIVTGFILFGIDNLPILFEAYLVALLIGYGIPQVLFSGVMEVKEKGGSV